MESVRKDKARGWVGFARLAAVAVLSSMATIVMGQAASTQRVVEAERFVVRDANGVDRAWFGMDIGGWGDEVGSPGMYIADARGEKRVGLRFAEGGALRLDLHDGIGKGGIGLVVSQEGAPALYIAGPAGEERFAVRFDEQSSLLMDMNDSRGKGGIGLVVTETGGKTLTLRDEEGNKRAVVHVSPIGTPYIELRKADGGVLFHAP